MIKVVISGYGRMGHMVEAALQARGIECAGASEDIASFDRTLAGECVCIDFTTPDAFRANYRALAENFKAVVVGTTGWNDIKDEVIGCFEKNGT
ncbi:MAG: 4-hydroxy-tetrahydrodipicolinate reductase, partial [Bacteroidales bacterium]|nr:4-hydroxy-tetrahydrodipicolinate reductase [Bacteroidales bacterium]